MSVYTINIRFLCCQKWLIVMADLVDVKVVEQFGQNPENDLEL